MHSPRRLDSTYNDRGVPLRSLGVVVEVRTPNRALAGLDELLDR
jgi:hypothetical protein